jgi:nucleoside-diphosphate-sugar epimerase
MVSRPAAGALGGRVALFGATGFIGPYLVRRLRRQGADVAVLARPTSDTSDIEPLGVTIIRGDITDAAAVRRAIEGADVVYYAARARGRAASTFACHHEVNVVGLELAVRTAIDARVQRFVHCGTAGVLGYQSNRPMPETDRPTPDTHYRRTKLMAEHVVHRYRDRIPIVTARLSSVYGPGSRTLLDVTRDVSSGRVTAFGRGGGFCHFTHVDDIVNGLLLCATHPAAPGATYHVAAEPIPTLRGIYEAIAAALGVPFTWRSLPGSALAAQATRLITRVGGSIGLESQRLQMIKFFTWPRAYDSTRARQELGYRSRVSIQDGMKQLVDWYRDAGLLEGLYGEVKRHA